MKKLRQALWLIALLVTIRPAFAENVNWKAIEEMNAFTRIVVTTQKRTTCYFVRATDDKLYCTLIAVGRDQSAKKADDLAFDRKDIREVTTAFDDDSKGFLSFIGAFGGGTGLDSAHQPTWFGGFKAGGPFSLDLQYDRIQGRNGLSAEGSAVLPIFRVARFDPRREKGFLKVFGEPGIGYRMGGGGSGRYASAKVLLVWLTDKWTYGVRPYVEIQHRFPVGSTMNADSRVAFGVMEVLCAHCGFS
jgi:hypothetical protein